MALITVGAGTPVVPPGTYPATLVAVTPKRLATKYSDPPGTEQDFLEWTWLVDGPDKDVEITSLTSLATGPKSTMFTILTALLGAEAVTVGAGFDEKDLVGKAVMVQVTEQEGFSKISGIIAAPAKGRTRPAPVETKVEETESEDDLPF